MKIASQVLLPSLLKCAAIDEIPPDQLDLDSCVGHYHAFPTFMSIDPQLSPINFTIARDLSENVLYVFSTFTHQHVFRASPRSSCYGSFDLTLVTPLERSRAFESSIAVAEADVVADSIDYFGDQELEWVRMLAGAVSIQPHGNNGEQHVRIATGADFVILKPLETDIGAID